MNISAFKLGACLAALGVVSCAAGSGSSAIPSGSALSFGKTEGVSRWPSGSTPIQNIIVIIQENRTFNNLFAGFPGATSTKTGYELINGKQTAIQLAEVPLAGQKNLNHSYSGFLKAWDNGNMDAFNEVKLSSTGKLEGKEPYVYVNPADIAPYWTLAEQYGLANAMFQTQGGSSFVAHQDLIRGDTFINSSESLVDNPPYGAAWGCDSPNGTKTNIITTKLQVERGAGPFPCTKDFPYYSSGGYKTLRDLLDAKYVTWKYYTPQVGKSGAIWDAYDVIAPVRYGSEWGNNVTWPETNIFNDISNGSLASVSWVVPNGDNSDHPHKQGDTGPSWVASIVNAVGQSKYWNNCAIIVLWDDWGGFYDPVAPPTPRDDQGGPGFRVPMILISPYSQIGTGSQGGYVSNTVYYFGSILRFIEDTFNLGRLGTTDGTSNSIDDMLNFNQSPRQFQTIGTKYSRRYFMHQKPSGLAPDDD